MEIWEQPQEGGALGEGGGWFMGKRGAWSADCGAACLLMHLQSLTVTVRHPPPNTIPPFEQPKNTTASPGNTREVEEMMLLGAQRAAADGDGGAGGDGGGELEAAALLGGLCWCDSMGVGGGGVGWSNRIYVWTADGLSFNVYTHTHTHTHSRQARA